ncbi:MAG TPA: bifunctional glutamate N-acetyltransferase/amino-acid acetyltransferase ArgJ [Alphaproteobacteria bacterium]|nr:bifunctional glutamate N-acetyltransferase/amino-acid acetyltransferase ArgJ [Alphaproteobacteria bacterium]
MAERSPLAPAAFPDLPPIAGVSLGGISAGIRYSGRKDVFLAELAAGSTVAGVFTRSLTASAPVEWCKKALGLGRVRAILCNSGNANAFNGVAGMAAVERTVDALAGLIGCAREEIMVASTGVIGEPLPDEKIRSALGQARAATSPAGWADGAAAIMTTDTFPKGATRKAKIGGVEVTLNGIAKGSGMIAPDMATMLAFVFTDAALPQPVLQALLARANSRSFNCVTVDSDTSTSDTALLAATGRAGNPMPASASDPSLNGFKRALESLLVDLAQQIVRDGEGARKFVTVNVTGAASARAAKRIAFAIANSPLVKTAIAGEDANWGRIVMAVGKAGEKADRDRLAISIGGIRVAALGARVEGYDESPIAQHMKGQEIVLDVDIGIGRGRATVWTCDLTEGYIRINANYRS